MKQRLVIISLAAIVVVIGVLAVLLKRPTIKTYHFPHVKGPKKATTLPSLVPTTWQRYGNGTPGSLAFLLTDENSSWLGLVHGLKSIGVPFYVTRDYRDALRHRVIIAYPALNGRSLPPEGLQSLAAHVRNGGTLVAFGVEGGGMPEIFRFRNINESGNHTNLSFTTQPAVADFAKDPLEAQIRLSNPKHREAALKTIGYLNPQETPLAVYEDGTAAITQSSWGRGKAYAFGIDIGHALMRVHGGRLEGLNRSYINAYEPAFDLFLRLIRRFYQSGEPDGVILHTVPYNKAVSVLVTHDVDYTGSLRNAAAYAEYERSRGVTATYFVQTKYVRDYNDDFYFHEEGVRQLARLDALGVEIASHSVAHANAFKNFPMGNGKERYPRYTPFVKSLAAATGGTILGELRVSKFLLEHFTAQQVLSFRPGHLSLPLSLPQALQASGYHFSSTLTANEALTHLPFQLMYDRGYSMETDLFEFPVTIEDELPPRLGERLPQALALARSVSRYGGNVTLLIHPNITGHKLAFEKGFIDGVRPFAWIGSVKEFGQWWAARNRIGVSVEANGQEKRVRLSIPQVMEGLTLEIPDGWRYSPGPASLPDISQSGRRLVIGRAQGEVVLAFATARAKETSK